MNAIDRFNSLPADRREAILARAEQLIREERAGRSAPESNQDAAGGSWLTSDLVMLAILMIAFAAPFLIIIGANR